MSYAAIIGTVVSVAGTAYSANQQKKAAGASGGRLDEAIAYSRKHPEAFGTKPDSWESLNYNPLFQVDPGYRQVARDTIGGNLENFDLSSVLSDQVNNYATADARKRIGAWDPSFFDSFSQQQQNTQNLLSGVLPYEDIQGITARRSELNSILGGAGNGQQTAADLGLTRMQLMQQGQTALNSNADLIGRIDPFARRTTPQSMFVDVNSAIQSAVGENWNDYQAASLERDASFAYEAMADPYQQGLLKLLAGESGIGAGAGALGGAGINYGQIGQQLSGIIGAYQNRNNNTQPAATSGGTSAWGAGYTGGASSSGASSTGTYQNISTPYTGQL